VSLHEANSRFTRRAVATAVAGGAVWAVLLARLFQMQVLDNKTYRETALNNRVRLDLQPPQRGDILDRFGRPLASHRQAGRVILTREQVQDLPGVLARIATIIDLPEAVQRRILGEARSQPAFVPTLVARELSYEDFSRLSVHRAELDGVQVEMALTRSYPRGRDLAHVVGYVARASDEDLIRLAGELRPDAGREERDRHNRIRQMFRHPDMRVGRSGVEFFADEWLRGQHGFRRRETNANGRVIRELNSDSVKPVHGQPVTLTIDSELQRKTIERFGQESGAAVVMDVATGHLLAVVSTPAFDPNAFVNGISQKDFNVLREDARAPLYHKAYDGTYPPGSTFKMVVAMAALESGLVKPEDRVRCPGHYRFGSNTWHCWKRGGHGSVDMNQGIAQSCDVYFYEIARRAGVERIADVARRMGFEHVFDVGMTGGRAGLVPDPEWKQRVRKEAWFEGETINFGIGQGQLNVSPLQLAVMTARLAANGHLVVPTLIADGPRPPEPEPKDSDFDETFIALQQAGMANATARNGDLGLGGVRMAGKTGTAQVRRISAAERASGVRANDEVARELRDHALFVGYAPHDAPRYAVALVVEHGGWGSQTAAPIGRDILREALVRDSGASPVLPARSAANPTPASGSGSGSGEGSP
jgi:penicillin-binding protein 2